MKPYGSMNKKAAQWWKWGDKIPAKFRRYFNKATRSELREELNKVETKQ